MPLFTVERKLRACYSVGDSANRGAYVRAAVEIALYAIVTDKNILFALGSI